MERRHFLKIFSLIPLGFLKNSDTEAKPIGDDLLVVTIKQRMSSKESESLANALRDSLRPGQKAIIVPHYMSISKVGRERAKTVLAALSKQIE